MKCIQKKRDYFQISTKQNESHFPSHSARTHAQARGRAKCLSSHRSDKNNDSLLFKSCVWYTQIKVKREAKTNESFVGCRECTSAVGSDCPPVIVCDVIEFVSGALCRWQAFVIVWHSTSLLCLGLLHYTHPPAPTPFLLLIYPFPFFFKRRLLHSSSLGPDSKK